MSPEKAYLMTIRPAPGRGPYDVHATSEAMAAATVDLARSGIALSGIEAESHRISFRVSGDPEAVAADFKNFGNVTYVPVDSQS